MFLIWNGVTRSEAWRFGCYNLTFRYLSTEPVVMETEPVILVAMVTVSRTAFIIFLPGLSQEKPNLGRSLSHCHCASHIV